MRRLVPWFLAAVSAVMMVIAVAEVSSRLEPAAETPEPVAAPTRIPSPSPRTFLAEPTRSPAQTTRLSAAPVTPAQEVQPDALAAPSTLSPPAPAAEDTTGAVAAGPGQATAATGGGALQGGLGVMGVAVLLRTAARRPRGGRSRHTGERTRRW